jgi:DNA-directed RNA polymerase specialized sigma24 family protein
MAVSLRSYRASSFSSDIPGFVFSFTSVIEEQLVERLFPAGQGRPLARAINRFVQALGSVSPALRGRRGPRELERYLTSLHLEDLSIACACAAGDEGAWEHFVLTQRPHLYRSADAIDPSGGARELADALYADLFGLGDRAGERQSLFRYFHGRSSLTTWLRAVLAQRYVDRLRTTRRLEALPDEDSAYALPAPVRPIEPERDRYLRLIRKALEIALANLAARDRLRLACYYAQELTLAQTGRGSASTRPRHRGLARTRAAIRAALERHLRVEAGLTDAEISRCFECVTEDAGPLDLRELLDVRSRSGDSGRKESALDRSESS